MQACTENLKLNQAEIEQGQTVLKSWPHRLMILLTTKCNLGCIMCHRVKTRDHFTVTLEALKKIYDLLPYVNWLNWQGGEVFLVEHFKEVFLKISEYRHIYQNILTNGLLIDEEWARILNSSNTAVTYSIDGVTKATYEKIRKGARFDDLVKSCSNMGRFRAKYNPSNSLEITSVVMKSNYQELDLFPEFCKKFGFTNLRFDYLHPEVIPEEDIILGSDLNAREYLKDELPKIEMECKKLNIGFNYTFKNALFPNSNKEVTRSSNQDCGKKDSICKLPWQQFTIVASEKVNVQPDCACIHPVGNLNDNTIEELWNGEKMQLYRESIIKGEVKNLCSQKCLIDMDMNEGISVGE